MIEGLTIIQLADYKERKKFFCGFYFWQYMQWCRRCDNFTIATIFTSNHFSTLLDDFVDFLLIMKHLLGFITDHFFTFSTGTLLLFFSHRDNFNTNWNVLISFIFLFAHM